MFSLLTKWQRSRLVLSVCLTLIGITLGCNRGPVHYPVSGTVTLDGQPVTDGEIIFYHVDDSPAEAGLINEGTFQFESLPGEVRVEITAVRDHPTLKVPGGSPGTWQPAPVNYIPERYRGSDSELRYEVPVGGNQNIQFELVSPK